MSIELKNLVLTRPLCVLDTETTGVDVREDRLVEIAILTVHPDGSVIPFVRRINPGRPITPAASAVHGITNADVTTMPSFATLATELFARLEGYDLAGFGITHFDLPLLVNEFARVGLSFRVTGRAVIDALAIYRQREARDLTAAAKFYLGTDHRDAHQATADAAVALSVLDVQVGQYGLPRSPAELHSILVEVDIAGKFRRGPAGEAVFGFGKYRGRPLVQIAAVDPSYLRWVLQQPFLDDVHTRVRAALAARHAPS